MGFYERVTLLKPSRQKAYILKFLLVKNLNYASQNSLMVFFDVEWAVWTFLERTVTNKASMIEVFWHLLFSEPHEANMVLILAVNNQLFNLIREQFFVTIISYLKLCCPRQHCLLLEHVNSAVDNNEPCLIRPFDVWSSVFAIIAFTKVWWPVRKSINHWASY